MTQLTLDAAHGAELQRQGLEAVEQRNERFVFLMREAAKLHSNVWGSVTTDDLRAIAVSASIYPTHRNCWGAILRGKGWKKIGMVPTKLKQGHAREIRVYRWEGA